MHRGAMVLPSFAVICILLWASSCHGSIHYRRRAPPRSNHLNDLASDSKNDYPLEASPSKENLYPSYFQEDLDSLARDSSFESGHFTPSPDFPFTFSAEGDLVLSPRQTEKSYQSGGPTSVAYSLTTGNPYSDISVYASSFTHSQIFEIEANSSENAVSDYPNPETLDSEENENSSGSSMYPQVILGPDSRRYEHESPSVEIDEEDYPPKDNELPQYDSGQDLDLDGKDYPYFSSPGEEVLDNKGRYLLTWVVNHPEKTIIFNITIRNTGWVALGLSKDGSMRNADICIGGIKSKGADPYLGDYFSDSERRLHSDARSDWKLIYAEYLDGITHLQVTRALDTCDPYDLPITEDLIHVIWAYGESDEYDYHFDKRGSFRVYLLDPILKNYETPLWSWTIAKRTTLPRRDTSYWCSIHKSPNLPQKSHVVEVRPHLPDTLSLAHTHHILLWRCVAPAGMSAREIFDPLVNYPGEECDFNDNRLIPTNLCMNVVTGWAIGGKPYVMPYTVGIPIGEDYEEYWLLQTHYNNPEELPITVESGLELLFTDRLRKHDSMALLIGYDLYGLHLIPPITASFEVLGMCPSECTREMIPPEGIEIASVILHAHNSAKKIKLHHFRNGTELPWIIKDDNYENTFQQMRNLREPRLILPGDQLITRCHYDNRWTNETVVAGFATRNEMCLSGIIINKRIPYFACLSQVSQAALLGLIGVRDYEWDNESGERIVTSPRVLAGQFLTDVSDSVDWTKSLRYKLQGITAYTTQNASCPQILIPHQQPRNPTRDVLVDYENSLGVVSPISTRQRNLHQDEVVSLVVDPEDVLILAKRQGSPVSAGQTQNAGVPKRLPGVAYPTIYPHNEPSFELGRRCHNQVARIYKVPEIEVTSPEDEFE